MSQVGQPALSARSQLRAHRIAALSALLALLATAAVVLVLTIDGGSSGTGTSVGARQQPALRVDGGPDETAVAATVGAQAAPSAGPDESAVARRSVGSRACAELRVPTRAPSPRPSRTVRQTAVPDRESARGPPPAGASVTFPGRQSRMLARSKRMAAAR